MPNGIRSGFGSIAGTFDGSSVFSLIVQLKATQRLFITGVHCSYAQDPGLGADMVRLGRVLIVPKLVTSQVRQDPAQLSLVDLLGGGGALYDLAWRQVPDGNAPVSQFIDFGQRGLEIPELSEASIIFLQPVTDAGAFPGLAAPVNGYLNVIGYSASSADDPYGKMR